MDARELAQLYLGAEDALDAARVDNDRRAIIEIMSCIDMLDEIAEEHAISGIEIAQFMEELSDEIM